MAKFAYNNTKNIKTGYTPFELNYGYHPHIFFTENIDLCSFFKRAYKLAAEL